VQGLNASEKRPLTGSLAWANLYGDGKEQGGKKGGGTKVILNTNRRVCIGRPW